VHLADHRRIAAQLTYADDETTASQLVAALAALSQQAGALERAPRAAVPSPERLRLEQAMSPRDAFFGETEQVPLDQAAGRVAAEMLTPYPPGIPAALPGERLTGDVLDYLRTGVRAGMVIPDAVDEKLESVRVVRPQ
jgi:arginine decarboxylase